MERNWFFLPVVIGMLLLVSCVQAAPVTDGLVAYYDGNLSGNSLIDLSGNNNTGYATIVTPGTNQLTGANYIDLNGVNSKIDVSNNAQTNVSSPISIEFIGSIHEFVRYGAFVSKYNNGGLGWYLSSSSVSPYNHARFAAGTSNGTLNCESDGSLVAGQVCHIVAIYDNNVTHIYINGVDSGSRTWNLPIIGNPGNITIGHGSGGLNYSNCSMYTFRLYNRSLSSAEVLQNYNNDLWRYKATPTILWTNPADIIYGTALSSTQLNANALVPGTFVYTPGNGTVLSAGTHTLNVDFTPTDVANYTNATANVTINVKEEPVPPVANFSYAMVNYPPLAVQFTDTSSNGANYQWNFGDGSPNVTVANPLHTFASPGVYTVQETVSNITESSTKAQNIDVQYNLNAGELQLWTFNASEVSDVPNNIYTTTSNLGKISNVSLTYNSTLGSIDSICWNNDSGETYITGAYPVVNQNLTFTMGVDSSSPWSYGYLHTSVADIGVRHASDGSYEIYSYWNNKKNSSYYKIPATSVVNNRVTVSIHSYDSNRTNVVTSGPTLYVTTPYTTQTTRNLPYTNVIQPLIYVDFWASGTGGWVNVHLYNITQSIPRNIITPYARNDIMAFGLDCPNTTNDQNGTDFLISHNQTATVFVEGGGAYQSDLLYNKNLFAHGFEEAIHFFPGFTPLDLAEAESVINDQTQSFNSTFGTLPTSWAVHQNQDNVSHATYAYNKYGMLYRNGYQGMGFIPNAVNLQNSTWGWWNISSAHGAISPCFTHQTDIYPAPEYAIDLDLFKTFVTNLNSNGIDLVSFLEWYYSSMAQNATTNVLEYDENHLKFQLNISGGYPVNMNVQTVISPSYLYCNGVSIPFEQTPDGIQFMSAGNGTYILTPLTIPLITWNPPADIINGTALSETQLNAVTTDPVTGNTVTGNFTYTPASGTVLSVGTHTLHVDFIPTDTANYTNASKEVTINVNSTDPKTPTITWNNPADIIYGTALSSTQLNAVATDPDSEAIIDGVFTYNPAAETVLNAGMGQTLHADFTPTDTANYTNASKNVTINVSNSPIANFTTNVTTGLAPLSVQFTDLSESAAAWSWDFGDGNTSTDQNASHSYSTPGTYTVSLNASNAYGHNISTKPNLITVTMQPVPGLVVYYDGNLSGNSLVDLSGNNNIGYATNVTSGTNQLTDANYINFNGVNSSIDVSNNAQTNISSPISIEFIGLIHEFKLYGALVSKYDDRNITGWYTGCSAHSPYQQVRFALCMWNATSGTTFLDGDKSVGALVAGQVHHIVVTYDNNTASTYIDGVNSGNHTWNLPIIGNSKNITIGSGSGIPNGNCSMYVFRLYNRPLNSTEVWQNYVRDLPRYKVTPTITWNTPADITAGTALSNTQLNAVATNPKTGNTVIGSFVYNLTAGTVLNAGNHTLHVDFTPTDTANYTNATANVTINVLGDPRLPVANFTADPTQGPAPLTVKFTDLSENATAWSWNFGNGHTSTAQNPSHTYNSPGTYTVSLNASNADGSNISTKPNLIIVNSATPLVTNGLVVYYDGSLPGNSLADLSGNKNTGYATSVTPWTNQLTGADYINLSGVNSKIDVSNNAQTNVSSPISIEFIGSINNFTNKGTLVSKYKSSGLGWYLSSSSFDPYNKARFAAGTSGGFKNYESDGSLVAGQVYHIVVTYDNNTTHTYIDGKDSDSRTWNSPIIGTPENIIIGYGSGLNYSNCSMYTFRLYNRSLSSDEVKQNYEYDCWRYKVTPTITWNTPADIINGTALSEAQLNAVATDPKTGNPVTGNFVYDPAAGTVLSVGTHPLHIDFTPTGTAKYTNAAADVTINVLEKPDDITKIKKLVYGDGGLPRYMGSHAMSQSGSGMNLVNSDMSLLGLVSTPYYQDNGGAQTNYTLLNSSISGVKWKNYYAPGSSASLLFSGNNRARLESINLSNDSLHLSNSVTYTEETLVTQEAVPVTGNAFQFYGDGLNTISGDTVQAYTDNGLIQNDCLLPEGYEVYSYYQNRTAGTTRNNSIELPLFSPQLTPMPCPSGYLGSLSFAIHADSQDPESLKTMMYGTNDIQNPVYGTKGYFGHGLICTWSAFAASTNSGAGIDNPLFKSTIDEMRNRDFEIVPHNVVAWMGEGYPTRAVTAYYLPWYYNNYSTRNWIDHGLGHGNRCTSLKRLGLDKTSEYYIGDLLRQYEIQYAWAYQDRNTSGGLSTSKNQSLGLPYDIVWTNTNFTWDDGTPMYEWASTYGADAGSLNYFKNDTLQTMINNHGVCFWHDYTAMNTTTFENYYYTKGNPYMINETYDNLLQNISEQKTAGRLWNPTVSQYIDYWRDACNVECKCTGQNTYTLINHNSADINGYAMRVTGPYTVRLDGNALNSKTNGADTIFWMNLSPGEHLLTLAGA